MQPEEFTLPSGGTVTIRGLSGFEVMLSRKKYRDDEIAMNAFVISCAMGVTEADGLEWLKTHLAGDFDALTTKVRDLSGVGEGADKSAVPGV